MSEVARDVAEHVGHLERLAEAHALATLLAQVPAPEPRAVGDAERRPEGADTAGDEVGVAVELVERVQRGQACGVLPGEAREVEEHTGRQRGQDRADFGAIRGRKGVETREHLVEAFEEPPLRGPGLVGCAGPRHRGDV